MNMNNFPRGFESATERSPLPSWVMWIAYAMVFGGYTLLKRQDAQRKARSAIAKATGDE